MEVFSFCPRDYFGSNTHIIFSKKECAVVDPSINYSKLAGFIAERGADLKYVILTHAHFDHIYEIDSWVNATGVKVLVGAGDSGMLSDPGLNCYKTFLGKDLGYFGPYVAVTEADSFSLGDEKIGFIETPGHTPGGISITVSDCVFVGDVFFADGGIGRCDLPGGDFYELKKSIKKLLSLPPDTKVYSGHGRDSALKEIKINYI